MVYRQWAWKSVLKTTMWMGVILLLCKGLAGPGAALGGDQKGPASIVRTYYAQVLEILAEEEVSKEQLKQELQGMARDVFTFQIMAQMSLGRSWKDLSPKQHKEFVDLFTRLLENTYFQKIEDHLNAVRGYSSQDLQVTDEIVFSSRKAEVQSKIAYEDTYVPVNYRFVKMDGTWKIYDVLVEEVSLVQNYRSQFTDRLQKISVSDFMQELRNKVHNLEAKANESDTEASAG